MSFTARRTRGAVLSAVAASLILIGFADPACSQSTAQEAIDRELQRERARLGFLEALALARARIRVSAPDQKLQRVAGTITTVTRDSLVLELSPGLVQWIARSEVTDLAVSQGRRRRTLEGAAVGLLTGTAMGFSDEIMVWLFCLDEDAFCRPSHWPRLFYPDYDTKLLAAAGAVLGAMVGTLKQTDVWRGLTQDHGAGIGLRIHADGTSVGGGLTIPLRWADGSVGQW